MSATVDLVLDAGNSRIRDDEIVPLLPQAVRGILRQAIAAKRPCLLAAGMDEPFAHALAATLRRAGCTVRIEPSASVVPMVRYDPTPD